MNRMDTAKVAVITVALLSGCGEPVRGVDADVRAAKAQARDAVQAAQDAAARVDELARTPAGRNTDRH